MSPQNVTPDQRRRKALQLLFFSYEKGFLAVRPITVTPDQREARYNRASFPPSTRRIALLPFALLVELLAPVPVGVLNLESGAAISVPN